MKVSIRQGVFETNSSSVHAIVIDTSGELGDFKHYEYYDEGVYHSEYWEDDEYELVHGTDTSKKYAREHLNEKSEREVRRSDPNYRRKIEISPCYVDTVGSYDILADQNDRLNYLWSAIQLVNLHTNPSRLGLVDRTIRCDEFENDPSKWKELILEVLAEAYPVYDFSNDVYDGDLYDIPRIKYPMYLIPLLKEFYHDHQLLKSYLCGKGSYVVVNGSCSAEEFLNRLDGIRDGDSIREAFYKNGEIVRSTYWDIFDGGRPGKRSSAELWPPEGFFNLMMDKSKDQLHRFGDKIVFIKESD